MERFDSLWEEFFFMQKEMQKLVKHLSGKRPSLTLFPEEPWVPSCDVFETNSLLFAGRTCRGESQSSRYSCARQKAYNPG